MDWERDGADWPNREASRFVSSGRHCWHLQEAGDVSGKTVLLLHGAGASTHSWRDVFPLLAADHHVVALDLPGQGFTRLGARARCGLAAMAADIATLLEGEKIAPDVLVGHSAGAVIAVQLALDLPRPPEALVAFNGAFSEFPGPARVVFPLMAKLLSANPFTAPVFARVARVSGMGRRLLDATGSRLDERGVALYERLFCSAKHVDATLAMMAQWELAALRRRLGEVSARSLLIAGGRDRSVPTSASADAAKMMPHAELRVEPEYGHLLHEERPDLAAAAIAATL